MKDISYIEKLLDIASNSISSEMNPEVEIRFSEIANLLKFRNGFYAFEGALLVRPSDTNSGIYGISDWNDKTLWRNEYADLTNHLVFFAEDVFGCQFALDNGQVILFEAETGERELLANNLNEWARLILEDYNYRTGYALAHEWQVKNGPLDVGKRLVPKFPFVLGGEYAVENLYALEDVNGMRLRGNLAMQLKDLPDGTAIKYQIVD